jgi:translocation and assembly module TamA
MKLAEPAAAKGSSASATLADVRLLTARLLLISTVLSLMPLAAAAGLGYHVSISAPSPLDSLLRDNLGIVRWQGSDYVDREQLDRLYAATPAEIETLLAPQGYFKPQVSASIRQEHGLWEVSFTIEPGDRVLVADVDVQLRGAIRDEADFQARYAALLEAWPLPIGSSFAQTDWEAAKRRGLQNLIIDRFPAAHLQESRAEIDPEKGLGELGVLYDSGPRFTLGTLDVRGLKRYPRELIDRMLTFGPGDAYSQQKLLDFQTALQNTPYFANVFLDVPVDPEHPDQVPVRVDLTEAPPRKTDAGVGYGSDKGMRASLGYRDANLRSKGWIGALDLNLQQREQTFDAKLQLPPDADGYINTVSYQAQHQDISGQQVWQHTVGAVRARLRNGIEVSQGLQFTRTWQKVDGGNAKTNDALVPSQSWTRRDLDNPNDPRRGTVINLQLGGAAKGLLSDASFLRAYGHIAWYLPINRDNLWLLRSEVGQVVTRDPTDMPPDWLFRAGGAGSVRGYGYQTLGVMQDGAVVGGRVLATASAEFQHRVWKTWRAAVFADVGGAASRWQDYHAVKGYGAGARWASPIGPFSFDLGYGAEAHSVRFHFSLGVGF